MERLHSSDIDVRTSGAEMMDLHRQSERIDFASRSLSKGAHRDILEMISGGNLQLFPKTIQRASGYLLLMSWGFFYQNANIKHPTVISIGRPEMIVFSPRFRVREKLLRPEGNSHAPLNPRTGYSFDPRRSSRIESSRATHGVMVMVAGGKCGR